MAITYPVTLPGPPAKITLRRKEVVGGSFSGTSLAGQTYRWGGNRWELSIIFPPMARTTAALWDAALTSLKGAHGSFLWGAPRYTAPLGTVSGSPVVSSTTADRAETIPVSGGTGTLLKGSMISIGANLTRRMYLVLADVNLAGGNIEIWPSLRGQAASGTPIVLNNTSCLFHLMPGSIVDSEEDQPGNIRFAPLTAWEDLR